MSEWELPESVKPQSIEGVGGRIWESGVYKSTIAMVYLDQAKSGAVSFNVELKNASGQTLKEAMYIRSGDKKGNKTYYTGKDKVDRPLPGYAAANSLCIAATGENLAKCMGNVEKKTIKIYNFDQKKDLPTERPVLTGLLNKPITVAVHQMLEDKNKKNDAGEYVPTGETRAKNECKFFGNAEGKSSEEILAGEEATVFDKWAEKNTGKVIDKSTKKDSQSSAAAIMGGSDTNAASGTKTASMFT